MALVQPSAGRAILVDTLNGMLITIPAKRNWFVIVFLSAWLCGWAMGWIFAFVSLIGGSVGGGASLFLLFWLIAWTAGGVFALRTVVAMVYGKEVISVTRETLSVSTPGKWFSRPRTYALADVRRLRAEQPALMGGMPFGMRRNTLTPEGTLRFDHGMRSVTFASGIDEPEARHILTILREKGLLSEANLA